MNLLGRVFLVFEFLGFFLLEGCGYRWGPGEIRERYESISVPYVEGDRSGFLTSAIIQRFSTTGALVFHTCDGDLILRVCLLQPEEENIGFIYAPEDEEDGDVESGEISNIVVSNEARLCQSAKVTVQDALTGCTILGPVTITAFLAYDFDPDFSDVNDHTTGLGQLEMQGLARETAYPALYRILSEKIVDYVIHSW